MKKNQLSLGALWGKGMGLLKNNPLVQNMSWIFFGNVFHSLLGFFVSAYVARVLTTNDNGLINYAASWVSFFSGISGLGFSGTLTKKFAEDPEHTGDHLCTCIVGHFFGGIIAIVALYGVVYLMNPGEKVLYLIVLCQSITMPISISNLIVYWFRYIRKANIPAVWRLVSFFSAAVWRVLALTFAPPENNVRLLLYLAGTVFETLLFTTFMTILYIRYRKKGDSFRFSPAILKGMLKISYPFILATIMVNIYGHADRIMIKQMMDNDAVAMYSVGIHFATAISIIPATLIEAFRPEVMRAKVENEAAYQKHFRQLYCIIFWISTAYCIFVTVFAKQIILIFYTEKYLDAIGVLSLAAWYSTFSYFGSVNNMFMVAEGKTKWVSVTTFTGAVANVIFNYFAIQALGAAGAALASLVTQFIANFVMMFVIPDLRPGFWMMLRGIAFRDVFNKQPKLGGKTE